MNSTSLNLFGNIRLRVKLALMLAALLLSLLVATLLSAPAGAASANVVVNNNRPYLGDSLSLSGSGWCQNEKISVWVTAPDGSVWDGGYVFADNLGTFDFWVNNQYRLISANTNGVWTLTAFGQSSRQTSTSTFQVVDPSVKAYSITAGCPQICIPALVDLVVNFHFLPGERISIWATDTTTGAVFGTGDYAGFANMSGNVVVGTVTPIPWDSTHNYVLTVYGQTSGSTVVVKLVPDGPVQFIGPGLFFQSLDNIYYGVHLEFR